MLHALNRVTVPLIANGFGILVYAGTVSPLVERFELIGAGLAFLLGKIAMAAYMAAALTVERRRRTATA
jgi:O-antigen/teichoic acid export membrane protein